MSQVMAISGGGQVITGATGLMAGEGTRVSGKVPSGSAPRFHEVLSCSTGCTSRSTASSPEARSVELTGTFNGVLDAIGRDELRIDQLIRRATRGRSFSQSELLSMQALVYRYGQQLDVASKLAEAVTGGARQMLNIQV